MFKIFIFLMATSLSLATSAQEKRALIVAISEYAPGSKIPSIASTNDVQYIQAALQRNNFKQKNIDTLINSKATKAGIIKALDHLAAVSNLNDIVVVHFSCHGQQIRDQSTVALGKDEDDGYDEALLPYDALAKYSPTGYRGENHLRDDELGEKLTTIRKKLGKDGSLLVLLDACHSGTATRDKSFATSRGEPIPFPDPENPMSETVNLSAADAKLGFFEAIKDSIANMVVISASGPNQINKQIKLKDEEVGSLSYSFYKAITELKAGSSYALLFRKIKLHLQSYIPDQIPLLEGNGEQMIFSGQYAGNKEHIYATVVAQEVNETENNVITIDRGKVDNMMAGSKCKIYLAGDANVFATGNIEKVENFRSIILVDKNLSTTLLYEVVAEEANFGNLHAALKIKTADGDKKAATLERQLKNFVTSSAYVSIEDNADFQLEIKNTKGKREATLLDRNDRQLWNTAVDKTDSLSGEQKKEFLEKIKKEVKINYLRTMPDGGSLAKDVEVQIKLEGSNPTENSTELQYGDIYGLQIINNSADDLYYTVLDIYPDNTVEIMYPYKGKEPADYLIAKRSTITRKLKISDGSPTGVETLKVIVSKQPMDLRAVFENKITRGAMQNFQSVMDDILNERNPLATRGEVANVKAEEIGIMSVSFIVKKREKDAL